MHICTHSNILYIYIVICRYRYIRICTVDIKETGHVRYVEYSSIYSKYLDIQDIDLTIFIYMVHTCKYIYVDIFFVCIHFVYL